MAAPPIADDKRCACGQIRGSRRCAVLARWLRAPALVGVARACGNVAMRQRPSFRAWRPSTSGATLRTGGPEHEPHWPASSVLPTSPARTGQRRVDRIRGEDAQPFLHGLDIGHGILGVNTPTVAALMPRSSRRKGSGPPAVRSRRASPRSARAGNEGLSSRTLRSFQPGLAAIDRQGMQVDVVALAVVLRPGGPDAGPEGLFSFACDRPWGERLVSLLLSSSFSFH